MGGRPHDVDPEALGGGHRRALRLSYFFWRRLQPTPARAYRTPAGCRSALSSAKFRMPPRPDCLVGITIRSSSGPLVVPLGFPPSLEDN